MVARRSLILGPLAALGVAPESISHVFLSHHHPDHTINVALFPEAEVVDFWARYIGDEWLDHDGDGYALAAHSRLWLTPGHTDEDASLIVDADDGDLRDDPRLVARRPDARDRPARVGPGGARGEPGPDPGGSRHRHPRPRSSRSEPDAPDRRQDSRTGRRSDWTSSPLPSSRPGVPCPAAGLHLGQADDVALGIGDEGDRGPAARARTWA